VEINYCLPCCQWEEKEERQPQEGLSQAGVDGAIGTSLESFSLGL